MHLFSVPALASMRQLYTHRGPKLISYKADSIQVTYNRWLLYMVYSGSGRNKQKKHYHPTYEIDLIEH